MKLGIIFLPLVLSILPARAADIVFGVSTGSAMPMTGFRQDVLATGLLKDFGDALARELQLAPRYITLPRKRVEEALASRRVDLLCDLRPEWLDGKRWQWSDTVFTNHQIVASRADTPPLPRLAVLTAGRVGTIRGYRYPEVEAVLGEHFQRDEAPSDDVNLTKLLSGRFDYLLANSLYYDYQRKVHPERERLHRNYFTLSEFDTYCALPPDGRVQLAQVNRAIALLRKRGDLQAIMDAYR